MKIALSEGRPAQQSDISALEAAIGLPLNPQFKQFVAHQNGANAGSNSFSVNGVAHAGGIDRFLPIEEILDERKFIDDIPSHAYPIASSAGGNYVLLDEEQGGAAFFWDHEVEGGFYKLADNFDAFLALLEPFDVTMIKPTAGQVKSAWIDPDFLKEFGE